MFTFTCTHNKELELNKPPTHNSRMVSVMCWVSLQDPPGGREQYLGYLLLAVRKGWMSELTWKLWTLGAAAAALLVIGLQRLDTQKHRDGWQNAVRQIDRQINRQTNKQTDSKVTRPQQRSGDDVGSLQVHQVIIIIIIVVVFIFVPSLDQASPQTPSLSLQLTWASDSQLTERKRERERLIVSSLTWS